MRFFRSLDDDELLWICTVWVVVGFVAGLILGHVLR